MGFRVGNRDDVERSFRMIFFIPPVVLCPLMAAGMLKGTVPPFLTMVLGGAVGGAIGYGISEAAMKLLNLVWPRKVEPPQEPTEK